MSVLKCYKVTTVRVIKLIKRHISSIIILCIRRNVDLFKGLIFKNRNKANQKGIKPNKD